MLTPRFDPSCSRQLKGLKTRVLLFSCMDSIYNKESLELNLKIDHTRADYIEVFDSGTLVTEQLPQVGSHPRNLSPTAVNPNVVCLTLTQCTLQLHNPLLPHYDRAGDPWTHRPVREDAAPAGPMPLGGPAGRTDPTPPRRSPSSFLQRSRNPRGRGER